MCRAVLARLQARIWRGLGTASSGYLVGGRRPCDGAPADVVPVEAFRPTDTRDGLVGARSRLPHGGAEPADIKHAAAAGEDVAAFGFGAGMENFHAFDGSGCVETLDHRVAAIGARIAFGGHNHRKGLLLVPAQIERLKHAV